MAYTDEEKELMNDVLGKLHEYVDGMEEAADEEGKDFKSFLYSGDWFLEFCKKYKIGENNGEDNAGLELGFIINFDMWINDSHTWPCMPKEKNDK